MILGRRFIDLSVEIDPNSQIDPARNKANHPFDNQKSSNVVYVAEDLQRQVSLSNSNSSGAISSTSAETSTKFDSQKLIQQLEHQAAQIAEKLDKVLIEFRGTLCGVTELSVECSHTYSDAISKTCDTVDSTIRSTYQLLAKSEELLQNLRLVPNLAKQIKEIKRLLDLFESHMQKSHG
uniref:BLOC-1-related complex subunit 6 C-terminal helix domain-containing protein n=1 Tax=Romanomermis culicivorax TaxID=13658 RepID=A0A915JJ74_ROMCU